MCQSQSIHGRSLEVSALRPWGTPKSQVQASTGHNVLHSSRQQTSVIEIH